MSGHCPGCGTYHEEDDNRLCAKCSTPTPPKTHAEVAKKLWKRLLDADVDACNPDCDDQTRGPVAILTTALREANIEGMIEMAHKYVEKGGAIPVPPGHILDDDGNVRRVLEWSHNPLTNRIHAEIEAAQGEKP